ncbi:leucyl/phenylalanyl-tRNA--protein transferase [Legionella adelaidensis]|uniref:leucyl/phenylalanyl-tRNA--protein transferase n=1 Tax=Legionella adelaidensis TaxID=45056 RepID=UPI0007312CA1|nr:leucyl/phenylalanyl-tRNA--protein transferase [Legionella adelaidensis]
MLDSNDLTFPDPNTANEEGLLAIGGDLSPARLLAAYGSGIFPWYEEGVPILWWSPDPRMILYPDQFQLSHSLRKMLKKPFECTLDKAFGEVITACATTGKRENATWITQEMQDAYHQLHQLGFAHSVEIWFENQLVGGLYGISLGNAFFGESMFHMMPNTSKLAMYFLCKITQRLQFDFIDCQLPTTHLQSLGGIKISRVAFLEKLKHSLQHPTIEGSWQKFI